MVDYFALVLSHGILLIAFWRLMQRDDLDTEASRAESTQDFAAEQKPEPRKGSLRRA
jgi:hypothetical protein